MTRGAVLLIVFVVACSRPSSSDAPTPTPNKLTEVARNLEVPWSFAWDESGRMFITERAGRVRIGSVVTTIPNVTARAETGLMGLALHPDFAKNRFVYLCYATPLGRGIGDVVVRFRENGGRLESPQTILTNIPAARFHAGCELKFGPDRKLYVTTGAPPSHPSRRTSSPSAARSSASTTTAPSPPTTRGPTPWCGATATAIRRASTGTRTACCGRPSTAPRAWTAARAATR